MLKTNLRGQIRQTALPKWKALLPLFEAVMNSFQAVQEDAAQASHKIVIQIDRDEAVLPGIAEPPITGFTISDTGVGFNDTNFDSFNTAYSEHKLDRGGKGLGRFMWLKAFEAVEIDSFFREEDAGVARLWRRHFLFNVDYDADDAPAEVVPDTAAVGTTIRLKNFRQPYKGECPQSAEVVANRLIEHFILILMQPNCPRLEIHDGSVKTDVNAIYANHFASTSPEKTFEIGTHTFSIQGFRLTAPRASRHRLIYAANSRAVIFDSLDQYIPNMSTRLADADGRSFVYLAIVQSPYLNQKVNNYRTDFDIGGSDEADEEQASLIQDEVRRSDIREKCIEYINDDLSEVIRELNETKSEKIVNYVKSDAPQYKPILKYKDDFINSIPPNASKMDIELALHKELHQREVSLKREGNKIITEAAKLQDYEDYRSRLSDFMEHSNELGISALAQYIMHRKIIIDFFEKSISMDRKTGKYPLEQAVHNIIFPMRSTDRNILYSQQNLWLIDERLTYHSFITSDKPLRSTEGIETDSSKRPDLFIFDRKMTFAENVESGAPINSVVVVEFKRPQRDDYRDDSNPLDQVFGQIADIRAGKFMTEEGRPVPVANSEIPAFAYIVCDITDPLKVVLLDRDAQPTPDGLTYYGYHRNHRIYYEVIDYGKVLSDAKKRNRIFFDRLNLLAPK